jgi:hypothetical protein
LWYLASASDDTYGKGVRPSGKVRVRLTLMAAEDEEMLRSLGVAAVRRARIARLVRQAAEQGGRLTVDDLAVLTCALPQTVETEMTGLARPSPEAIAFEPVALMLPASETPEPGPSAAVAVSPALRAGGPVRQPAPSWELVSTEPVEPPLNGSTSGLSRRARAVQLHLHGLRMEDIVACTAHPEASIRRYLSDFCQVAALYNGGADRQEISMASGRPESLIAEYIDLYEGARRDTSAAPRLTQLLDEPAAAGRRGRR